MNLADYFIKIEKTTVFKQLMGDLSRGALTAVYGPPKAGKSTLLAHLGTEAAIVLKGNLAIFDTENSIHTHLALQNILSQMFGVELNLIRVDVKVHNTGTKKSPDYKADWKLSDPIDNGAVNVFIVKCPDIVPISILHGRGMKVEPSANSGKVKASALGGTWVTSIDEAPIHEFLKEHNVQCIIYDSITNPLDEIPAIGENFPARADLTESWLIQMHKLSADLNIPVLCAIHESTNETDPFSKELKPQGGKGIGYNLKHVMYLLDRNRPGLLPSSAAKPQGLPSNARALYCSRDGNHPLEQPFTKYVAYEITAEGLRVLED